MSILKAKQDEINEATNEYNSLVDQYNSTTDKDTKQSFSEQIDKASDSL